MAEPVSSIVTLATVSLHIIQKITKFIQETRVVDTLVQRLQENLHALEQVIRTIELACKEAQFAEDDPFIHQMLADCHTLLENVQRIVQPLAFQRPQTLFRRASLNLRLSRSRQNIEGAIQETRDRINLMHVAISCRTLMIGSATDRNLPASARYTSCPAAGLNYPLKKAATSSSEAITFSDVETVNDDTTNFKSTFPESLSRSSTSDSLKTVNEPQVNKDDHAEPPKDPQVEVHSLVTASRFDGNTSIETMKEMLQTHEDSHDLVNTTDEYGRTPLHLAARSGDVTLGQALLNHRADINARDSDVHHPHSVLDIALAANQYPFAKLLLENGADEGSVLKTYRNRLEEIKAAIEVEKQLVLKMEARKNKEKKNRGRGRGKDSARILRKEKRGCNCGATNVNFPIVRIIHGT